MVFTATTIMTTSARIIYSFARDFRRVGTNRLQRMPNRSSEANDRTKVLHTGRSILGEYGFPNGLRRRSNVTLYAGLHPATAFIAS